MVVWDRPGDTKLNKADDYRVPKITEDEFMEMVRGYAEKDKDNRKEAIRSIHRI